LFKLLKECEPPLHKAIINDHIEEVRTIIERSPISKEQRNSHGFTPLELAHFLDKKELLPLLTTESHRTIALALQGENNPSNLHKEEFEQAIAVHYLSHLKFPSYSHFKEVIKNCPLIIKNRFLGQENHLLGEEFIEKISQGFLADVTIRWIDHDIGYGLFANDDLSEGAYIGEYTGIVRPLPRSKKQTNGYCFHYPTRFWSWNYYVIDSYKEGNELRFVNHSKSANVEPKCLYDRGLLHIAFFAKRDIERGEELTFDYGEDYWQHRQQKDTYQPK